MSHHYFKQEACSDLSVLWETVIWDPHLARNLFQAWEGATLFPKLSQTWLSYAEAVVDTTLMQESSCRGLHAISICLMREEMLLPHFACYYSLV